MFQYEESIVHIKYNELERSKTCPYLLTHFLKELLDLWQIYDNCIWFSDRAGSRMKSATKRRKMQGY